MAANLFTPVVRERGLTVTRWAAFTLAYFIAASLGSLIIPVSVNVPIIWPASGIALAGLLLSKKSDWTAVALVIFFTNLAANLVTNATLVVSLGFSTVNTLQALGAAWLLQHYLGPAINFSSLKEVLVFIALTISTAALSSLGGAVVTGLSSHLSIIDAWFLWTLTTEMGVLLFTPVIIIWSRRRFQIRPHSVGRWVETVFFLIILVVFSGYAFINATAYTRFLTILPYFIFPLLFWAALRFGPHGASITVLVISVFTVSGSLLERGPFANLVLSLSEQPLAVQVFLGITAVSAYLAAAIFAERNDAEQALRESEDLMRSTMINAPVIITQLDRDGKIIYQNRDAAKLRMSTDDTNLFDGITTEYQVEISDAIVKTFETGLSQRIEVATSDNIGNSFWYDVRFGPVMSKNQVASVTMIATDITDRKQAEAALRQSEERYSLAARGANDGIWDWDLQTNRVYYSSRWKQLLGCAEDAISVSPDEWLGRIHPEDVKYVKEDIAAYLQGTMPQFISEHRIMHRNGTYRWFLVRGVAVSSGSEKPHRLAGSMTDTTIRKATEERLRHDAMHDSLTKMANRSYFSSQLQRSIDLAHRHTEYTAAVMFIDLDRFKVINESLGHSAGDQLLIIASTLIQSCVRPEDTVARFGGDDFGILLEEIKGVNDAIRVSNRIQARLAEPFNLEGHEVVVTASIGINLVAPGYERAEDLLRDAEMAMYGAKANGRGRYQIFDKEMHARSLALFRLEAELRGAVERQEFRVYYQPIYDSTSGAITCLEALLRWFHPERGLVYPDHFIPLAEETGLIISLGEWVLRQVCDQIRLWLDMGLTGIRVAVNISARQLQDPSFPALVRAALAASGIEGSCLQLEITESAAMQDFDTTVNALNELIQVGAQISLDDFGMRYSSLDYLKRFPVNTIKIDKSFVWDISEDPDDAAITSAIISVAHILKLNVVAEGVETLQQLEFLLRNRCDEIQGHFYSRAQTSSDITRLFQGKSAEANQDAPQ